jgi:uncharacterized protein (UPF0332 family)
MIDQASIFLDKATESLVGAESELASGRYNNAANRAYYSCFQAAIAALQRAGVGPRGGQWGHEFVQAEFVRLLIDRRKLYPSDLREVLSRNYKLREVADYGELLVTQTEASRTVRRARNFLNAILTRGSEIQ